MTFVLGVIPARGGSRRIPLKNLKRLAGKPLIAHTILAAKKSQMLDRVVVSTEDSRIKRASTQYGAEVPFLRPRNLCRASTPMLPVIRHAVGSVERDWGHSVDIVTILQPTSPFRTSAHIDAAIRSLMRTRADTVVSVCEAEYHPWWTVRLDHGRLVPFLSYRKLNTERHRLPKVYRETGGICVTRRDVLMGLNRIRGPDTRAIVLNRISSLDIDDQNDLLIAECIAKRVRHLRPYG